ncbi:MAG TPA: hypothetical protein P5228_05345 [Bacteroidales bacterium]|nr:hypothetical protein [Bacteroidales bacterium]HRZ47772.1 hypothetical protein [Bacteroidales bacterium]
MAKQQNPKGKSRPVISSETRPRKPGILPEAKPMGTLAESLIIVVFALALYANTLGHKYALDDTMMITSNAYTKEGFRGMGNILMNDAFTGFHGEDKNLLPGGRYRPLSQLMFAAEYGIFGEKPLAGHLFNILLYALACLVLYKALLLLLNSERFNLAGFSFAFVVALLFTVHPLHTEAVANIKGRDEILTLLGFATTLWLSLAYLQWHKRSYLFLLIPVYFLSLLSKEHAITFLAAIPLLLLFREQRFSRNNTKVLLYLGFGLLAYLALRFAAIGIPKGSVVNQELLNDPFVQASFSERLATILYTWIRYIGLVLFPHPLTHDYYPWHITYKTFANPAVLLSVLFFAGGAIYALKKIRKPDLPATGFLLFAILFSSQSNLLVNIGTFMNERFVFIALLGILLVLAWLLQQWIRRTSGKPTLQMVVVLIVVLGFSIKTISRNTAWKDDFTLFTTDVTVSENSAKVNTSAGGMLLDRAQKATDDRQMQLLLNQALPYLRKGVELHPQYLQARVLLGNALLLLNDYKGAWESYAACIRMSPGYQDALTNARTLGTRALLYKDFETAGVVYGELMRLYPGDSEYATGYAEARLYRGDYTTAEKMLDSLAVVNPGNSRVHHLLGQLWGRFRASDPAVPPGRRAEFLEKSRFHLEKAIAGDTANYGMVENLAIVYGMRGDLATALRYFEKALTMMEQKEKEIPADLAARKIRSENFYRIHRNIGDTYRNMGRVREMEEHYKKAGAYSPGSASSP